MEELRKKAAKNQLSMDISHFIKSQQEALDREKQLRQTENARERQQYVEEQAKLKQE